MGVGVTPWMLAQHKRADGNSEEAGPCCISLRHCEEPLGDVAIHGARPSAATTVAMGGFWVKACLVHTKKRRRDGFLGAVFLVAMCNPHNSSLRGTVRRRGNLWAEVCLCCNRCDGVFGSHEGAKAQSGFDLGAVFAAAVRIPHNSSLRGAVRRRGNPWTEVCLCHNRCDGRKRGMVDCFTAFALTNASLRPEPSPSRAGVRCGRCRAGSPHRLWYRSASNPDWRGRAIPASF